MVQCQVLLVVYVEKGQKNSHTGHMVWYESNSIIIKPLGLN
jgi:hypothetical protein